jgi:hypothetical protein
MSKTNENRTIIKESLQRNLSVRIECQIAFTFTTIILMMDNTKLNIRNIKEIKPMLAILYTGVSEVMVKNLRMKTTY